MTDTRVRVTLVVPACPKFHSHGLLMRAASLLKLLANWGAETHLVIVNVFSAPQEEPEAEISELCRSIVCINNPSPRKGPRQAWIAEHGGRNGLLSEWRRYNDDWQADIKRAIEEQQSDLILIFRFMLVPFVLPAVSGNTPVWLDVDELDSSAKRRMSRLYAQQLSKKSSPTDWKSVTDALAKTSELEQQAGVLEKMEAIYLPRFQRIFVSSLVEKKNILERISLADVCVLPNIYPHVLPQPGRKPGDKCTMLMVGNYEYFPNLDGLRYFCREILPLLQMQSPVPVELSVVGGGLDANLTHSLGDGVRVIGWVPDTTPYYAECDFAVVPLRAAGGTRIKILEAFSHERAVVSTTIGAEGLPVTSGRELLIADGGADFSAACVTLINDAELCTRLAQQGHALFKEHYTMEGLLNKSKELFSGMVRQSASQQPA